MAVADEAHADGIDERRLARPGYAADADAMGAAGVGEQAGEQLLGLFLMVRAGGLDEGDRPPERRPVGGEHPVDVGVEIDSGHWSMADFDSSVHRSCGGESMGRAGRAAMRRLRR